jgi:hypothetical protein
MGPPNAKSALGHAAGLARGGTPTTAGRMQALYAGPGRRLVVPALREEAGHDWVVASFTREDDTSKKG